MDLDIGIIAHSDYNYANPLTHHPLTNTPKDIEVIL